MTTRRAEVLVVGSGAGGAPTAAILAEAGFDVLIVEEGPWVSQGTTIPFSLEQMEQQYRSAGVTVALGRPSISYAEGRCAGGGTEINSGLFRRPSEETLHRWRHEHKLIDFDDDIINAALDEVEAELGVQPMPPTRHNRADDRLRNGAQRMGWHHVESPRWMTYPEGAQHRPVRQSMTATYLPRSFAAGAQMLCEHRIDKFEHRGGRAYAAVGTDEFGQPVRYEFDHLFICGGAIQTPALLQRSRVRGRAGAGLAVHPTIKLAARFNHAVNEADDVPVHQVMEFAPELSFGGSASHPGLVALTLADNWARMRHAVTDWSNIAVYYAAIRSEGRGRVTAIPGMRDPLVTYRLTRNDKALLSQGLSRLSLLMLEAGADEVYPAVAGSPIIRSRRDLADAAQSFSANAASVMTVHICSTVAMGECQRSRADSFGRVRGLDNVIVNDASLLPDAPGVNPQAVVTAVALRNARRFAQEHR